MSAPLGHSASAAPAALAAPAAATVAARPPLPPRAPLLTADGTHGPAGASGAARWLVTFADLMALLTVFFMLMLSMSSLEPEVLSRQPEGMAGVDGAAAALALPADDTGAGARYLAHVIASKLDALGAGADIVIGRAPGHVTVTFPLAVAAGPLGRELGEALSRAATAAPGRITLFVPAPHADADAGAWERRLIQGLPRAPGVARGVAGWLMPGRAMISIADTRRAS